MKAVADLDTNERLVRHDRAEVLIAALETEYKFELPLPWREVIPQLLLRGLTDPMLHVIFTTILRVEGEAGRLPGREVQTIDYKTFLDK